MLHDQCCPALIENDAVRFENSLHNTHTKIRNETSTSREDWISEFTEPKEQGYWILTHCMKYVTYFDILSAYMIEINGVFEAST